MNRSFRSGSVALVVGLFLLPSFASAATFERPLSIGSTGSDVSALQTILQQKGFYGYPEITGYYGPITLQAVADFQRSVGLDHLGYVGPATRAILNGEATSTPPTLMLGSRGPAVSALQQMLKDKGFYTYPEITGYFGPITQAALLAYQSANSLPVTGTYSVASTPAETITETPEESEPEPAEPRRRSGGGGSNNSDDDEEVVVDTTAPAISAIASSPSQTTATISWTTDESADSQVEYGTSASYGATTTLDTSLTTSHSVPLSGLTASTLYHYRILSRDAAGNLASSTDQTFTTTATPDTTAPLITSVVANAATTTATITWTTDEAATSHVVYGPTTSYGSASTSAALLTSHSIGLTSLTANTAYHYAVVSADAQGNTATSSDGTFTTLPSWVPMSNGATPTLFADYTSEGSTNHYWFNSQTYGSASAVHTASGGSFTRASTAFGQTAAGTLTSFSTNAPRVTDLGFTIENSATNSGFPSEQNVSFFGTATNATIASSTVTGPYGTTNFYMTASTTVAGGNRQKNVTVANDSGIYQDSIFVASKSGGQTVRWLAGLVGGTTKQSFVDFNITTGAVVAGSGTVQPVSGGWRVSINIANNSTGNTTLYSQLFPAATGSGTADFGGWQLEKSPVLSSYIPTTSATAMRSADTYTRTGGNDLSAASGQLDIAARTSVGTTTQVLWQRDDGTQNNRLTIYRDPSRFIHFVIVSGGVIQSDRTIQVVADNTDFSVSMAWAGTLASYTVNGGIPFVEAAVTLPTGITTERLGADTSGNQWGGRIRTIASYSSATITPLAFYDSFNRANTSPGTMSNPPVGSAYGFYGPYVSSYPLPAATNGYISNKGFVADQDNAIYMEQNLGNPVDSVNAKISWTPSNGSTGFATAALLIYNTPGNIDNCIHIQVSRINALIQKRVNGTFTTLSTVTYPQQLSRDGTIYDAGVTISGSTVTLTVNGSSASATDPALATFDGNYVIWENYMIDATDALKIQAVSAQ